MVKDTKCLNKLWNFIRIQPGELNYLKMIRIHVRLMKIKIKSS